MLMKRFNDYSGSGNANMDLAVFITMGIVVSSFALPIIMARVNAVSSYIDFKYFCYFKISFFFQLCYMVFRLHGQPVILHCVGT